MRSTDALNCAIAVRLWYLELPRWVEGLEGDLEPIWELRAAAAPLWAGQAVCKCPRGLPLGQGR